MPIPLNCDCGRSMRIKDELAGKRVRCPGCSAVLEVPTPQAEEDEALEVVVVNPDKEEVLRRAGEQTEGPVRTAARRRLPEPDEEAEPEAPRPRKRRPSRRYRAERSRQGPAVAFERGWFGSLNAGVVGGLLMILIAVVWFVGGLSFGIIFFYPPVLFVIGLIAFFRGVVNGQ